MYQTRIRDNRQSLLSFPVKGMQRCCNNNEITNTNVEIILLHPSCIRRGLETFRSHDFWRVNFLHPVYPVEKIGMIIVYGRIFKTKAGIGNNARYAYAESLIAGDRW